MLLFPADRWQAFKAAEVIRSISRIYLFLTFAGCVSSQSNSQKHKGKKITRRNLFQCWVAEDTVSSHVYGRPEFGSTLALLGSISRPLSPTRMAGLFLLLILLLLERTRQTAVKQQWHDPCQQTQVPATNLWYCTFIQKYICYSFPSRYS